jgi:hypothetical protein
MSQEIEVVGLLCGESPALAIYTPLDALFVEYRKLCAEIEQIASYVDCASDVMPYFCDAARIELKIGKFSAQSLFRAGPAIRSLDARFWSRAMRLTDVLDLMPAEARNEWSRQIKANETPPFEPESVRATLQTMIASRAQFFADRVEGIFFNLSDHHATNSPEGFYKRMIIARMRTCYGSLCHEQSYFVHDLRCVIAKFSGRGEPPAALTNRTLESIHQAGEFGIWHDLDGGAIRLRLFKVGTCHLEVHPEVAYRLNMVLAWRNPAAIPVRFRKAPAREKVGRPLHDGLITFDIIAGINEGLFSPDGRRVFFTESVSARVEDFLLRQGGKQDGGSWQFDYDFGAVLHEMERTGLIHERAST